VDRDLDLIILTVLESSCSLNGIGNFFILTAIDGIGNFGSSAKVGPSDFNTLASARADARYR